MSITKNVGPFYFVSALGETMLVFNGKYLVQTHLCVLVKRCSDFGSTSWQEIRSRHEEGCEYIRLPKGDNIEEDMLERGLAVACEKKS